MACSYAPMRKKWTDRKTEVLGNVAVKALNDLGTGGLIGPDQGAEVFRVELTRQHSRVHQITEQHGELAAFGVRGRRRSQCGEGRRAWRVRGARLCPWL